MLSGIEVSTYADGIAPKFHFLHHLENMIVRRYSHTAAAR